MKTLVNKTMLFLALSLGFVGSALAKSKEVPYKLAKNYFIKNTYPEKEFHFLRITSQEKFDKIFGMATLMGEAGKPTAIDFSKNFVIALINGSSNHISGVKINSLSTNNDNLNLVYSFVKSPQTQSHTSRYCAIIIVDKKHKGTIHLNYVSEDGVPAAGGDLDEFGCKPSTGYTWSVMKKKCISIREENGKILMGSIKNVGLIFGDKQKEVELIGFNCANYAKNLVLKQVPKTKMWKNGNVSISFESGKYILRDKKVELAKSDN